MHLKEHGRHSGHCPLPHLNRFLVQRLGEVVEVDLPVESAPHCILYEALNLCTTEILHAMEQWETNHQQAANRSGQLPRTFVRSARLARSTSRDRNEFSVI